MKKALILITLSILTFNGWMQKTKNQAPPEDIYKKALLYGDLDIAKGAVYQILVSQPENISWKDTLCLIYYSQGNYVQSITVGKEILKTNENNLLVMEVVGSSFERISAFKESLELYEKLAIQKPLPSLLYSILSLQYRLKRFAECFGTGEKLLSMKEAAQSNVRLTISDDYYQDVSYQAATSNVLGMASAEMGKIENAEKYFKQSLQLSPDFLLPKNNLEKLNTK
jgi:tetratricopeptide (TPR) repeat protein